MSRRLLDDRPAQAKSHPLREGGAKVLGKKAAIAALEEGEDHGVKDYKADVKDLDPQVRAMVETQLRPAQKQTHDRLSALKHRM